jgi:hypothetical protein
MGRGDCDDHPADITPLDCSHYDNSGFAQDMLGTAESAKYPAELDAQVSGTLFGTFLIPLLENSSHYGYQQYASHLSALINPYVDGFEFEAHGVSVNGTVTSADAVVTTTTQSGQTPIEEITVTPSGQLPPYDTIMAISNENRISPFAFIPDYENIIPFYSSLGRNYFNTQFDRSLMTYQGNNTAALSRNNSYLSEIPQYRGGIPTPPSFPTPELRVEGMCEATVPGRSGIVSVVVSDTDPIVQDILDGTVVVDFEASTIPGFDVEETILRSVRIPILGPPTVNYFINPGSFTFSLPGFSIGGFGGGFGGFDFPFARIPVITGPTLIGFEDAEVPFVMTRARFCSIFSNSTGQFGFPGPLDPACGDWSTGTVLQLTTPLQCETACESPSDPECQITAQPNPFEGTITDADGAVKLVW